MANLTVTRTYYWGLDHQSNQFDDQVRTEIKSQPALKGLERTSDTKLIATSNERSSKAVSKLQQLRGRNGWVAFDPSPNVKIGA
jgi:hypothetical protein